MMDQDEEEELSVMIHGKDDPDPKIYSSPEEKSSGEEEKKIAIIWNLPVWLWFACLP